MKARFIEPTPTQSCVQQGISCTNYRTLDVIDVLESDLGVPVVSSNGATLWDALGQLGVTPDSLPGTLGSLDPETADDGSNAAVNR